VRVAQAHVKVRLQQLVELFVLDEALDEAPVRSGGVGGAHGLRLRNVNKYVKNLVETGRRGAKAQVAGGDGG
jgi:hypothetical protein